MIRFDIMTLFPEYFDVMQSSVIGKALSNGCFRYRVHNIRDYSADKHKRTDDYPYGGGPGMVMTPQPIFDTWRVIERTFKKDWKRLVICMSPGGKVFTQDMAESFSCLDQMTILCGHYEGIDQRVIDALVDREISIGDYVLTGGELPALVVMDAVIRWLPGVLTDREALYDESHGDGLLEYPQYTRPANIEGRGVPSILLSGHHKNIEKWRYFQSLKKTEKNRPDLFAKLNLPQEIKQAYDIFKRQSDEYD